MDWQLFRTFHNAVLDGGVLHIPELTSSELQSVCTYLREQLVTYQIRHCKIIGVSIHTISNMRAKNAESYIAKVPDTDISYVDVMVRSAKVIYPHSIIESTDSLSTKLCSMEARVTSSEGLFREEGGIMDTKITPLIEDIVLMDAQKDMESLYYVSYGKGLLDFKEVQNILRGTPYIPVRQLYDLTSILNIYPSVANQGIRFMYKERVNEDILLEILKDNYA